jgi:hypothetical protein
VSNSQEASTGTKVTAAPGSEKWGASTGVAWLGPHPWRMERNGSGADPGDTDVTLLRQRL